ncbi:hypothetical protein HF086_005273 [Spodoptera exigua]|uniref:Uncharacterized protein n=1 Tax=Spodoptera exigua TaxID=7107 RepID=A0A922MZ83_SPOEX|nr:hypothetical protein HF086_005273 [Spodoptera exigua]
MIKNEQHFFYISRNVENFPMLQAKRQKMDITRSFHSYAWCKPDWCYPSMSKESNELLRQCAANDVEGINKDLAIDTPGLEKLKVRRSIEKLKKNIVSTYPLIHERVLLLITHFLIYKSLSTGYSRKGPSPSWERQTPTYSCPGRKGTIGPRFQRENRMDCEDILITAEQNVPEQGYGEEVTPTTCLNVLKNTCIVYVCVGLGVWKISKHQVDVYVLSVMERVRHLLRGAALQHVADLNFAYITPSDTVLGIILSYYYLLIRSHYPISFHYPISSHYPIISY